MQPLEGITVIALEQAVAAPLATRHLADLGARVIKIERPGVGDFARAYDTTVRGLSSHFVWLNRSKQSMTLDVKAPEAPDVLARLFSCADVFVQNLPLGARVITIERPAVGGFARAYDSTVRGLSSPFVWLNRSKPSVTLAVKAPEAPDVLARLFSCADVFVQNLAPGAADRLSLGAGELRQKYPKLIVCNLLGYGASGPYRDKRAYDLLIQSEA